MSYKFDSLITILKKLDGKEKLTVFDLMNDLEVSERTAYRYLQTLQVAGFPIAYNRQKESYVFDDGYELGKPALTIDENLALALAKKFLNNFGVGMDKSLESIERKLSAKNSGLPKHIIMQMSSMPVLVRDYLGIINQAIGNFQRIEIKYNALNSGEETVRKIDSYYLFFQDECWHLRGYCHLREEFRTFALDRIVSLIIIPEYFIPQDLSPSEELEGSFGMVVDGEPAEVVLIFEKDIAHYIRRKKWHGSQKVTELEDGKIEVTFRVNGYEGIKRWILQWLPYVSIKSPAELRNEILADLKLSMKRI